MTTTIAIRSGFTLVTGRTKLSFAPIVGMVEEYDESSDDIRFLPISTDARGYFCAVPTECRDFVGIEFGQASNWTERFAAWKGDDR